MSKEVFSSNTKDRSRRELVYSCGLLIVCLLSVPDSGAPADILGTASIAASWTSEREAIIRTYGRTTPSRGSTT